jgi:hypothetical protein
MYVPVSCARGVHVNVPLVWSVPGVNAPGLSAGNTERFACNEAIAWPSGSEAVTAKLTTSPPPELRTSAGPLTSGARSVSVTTICVVTCAESALAAVHVTV